MIEFNNYKNDLNIALDKIDEEMINSFLTLLKDTIKYEAPIVVFGNGGSSAISEHLSCDFMKCIRDNNTNVKPYVLNLSSNMSLMTALSNDFDYSECYSKQIDWLPYGAATVIAISSSGNSKNIVNGLNSSRKRGFNTLAMVGFDGGVIKNEKLADYIIHVDSFDYAVVEDSHHILMHYLSKKLME